MVRIVKDESPARASGSECDCGHASSMHDMQSGRCLANDPHEGACSCAEFRPAEDVPISVRVRLIRDQLERARAIIFEAQARPLAPEERFAVSQLAGALVELSDAVRALLID
jgi:hypothetical protein